MGRAERHARGDRPVSGDAPNQPASHDTRLLHTRRETGPEVRTVGPPIQKGSTVLLPSATALYDDPDAITYGRSGLGVHQALENAMCELEAAVGVSFFPSGLAAVTAAMMAVLRAGDEVLVSDAIYKPTRRFCDRFLARYGVRTTYYSPRATPDDLMKLAGPGTRLIVLESPGSLTFEMQDVPAIAAAARSRGILTLADNTWAAGLYFRPLDHGVDISVQALTKYVGGHSDVFMGSAAARDERLVAALREQVLDLGWATPPEDAYMMLRGLRTLPTRLARHASSGLKVADRLKRHPRVLDVLHPALPHSPDHAIWRRDFTGASGLFAFVIKPGPTRRPLAFLDALRVFGLGFSWGGFESLALDCDPQFGVRASRPSFGGPVVRLSIGLEDPDDLIADLEQALAA